MQPTHIHATNTLLTYSLVTSPTPVQVSPSTTVTSVASLTFVVSCPRSLGAAMVSQIMIVLPVDGAGKPPDPTNLATIAPPLASASISSSGTDIWTPVAGPAPNIFIFRTKAEQPVQIKDQSLTIRFTGINVNTLVGTALLTLSEWAAPGSNPPPPISDPPSGTVQFAVAKFPYGFYAGNFTSDKPMVQNGQKPVLSWTGSVNAKYLMLYDENTPLDVSTMRSWSPPQPLTKTTTFILRVSAQREGQTASIDFSITIEVGNPSLSAKDLTVLTNTNLKGAVAVGTSSAPADLTLNGNVTTKNATVSGTLNGASATLTGNLTAATARVNGNLNTASLDVSGAAKLTSTLDVSGAAKFLKDLTASGPLVAGGTVSLLGSLQKIDGAGNATTDGFIIGTVDPPSQGPTAFNTTIFGAISYGGNVTRMQVTGGGTVSSVDTSRQGLYGAPVSNMFILPVRKGARWAVGVVKPYLEMAKADISFFWIPIGVGSPTVSKEAPTEDLTASLSAPAVAPPALQFQFSGQARLADGRAVVQFPDNSANHTDEQSYRVMLTPTERCGWLAVTEKSRNSFVVEELPDGKSNASFDWFVSAG